MPGLPPGQRQPKGGAIPQTPASIQPGDEVVSEPPLGWYTGRCSMNTTRLVMEEGGFLYSSDDYSDDLPYWLKKTDGGRHLIIPYTLDANDMRFATPQGFNSGDQFFTYLKDSFDVLYAEGATSPKMMSVGLHCRLVGRPGRFSGRPDDDARLQRVPCRRWPKSVIMSAS